MNDDFFKSCVNDIVLGNNVEVLAKFPNDCIDLTVTSPPYDNIRNYNKKIDTTQKLIGRYSFPFEELAQQLYRVTKMGGMVVWVVNDQVINGNGGGSTKSGNSFRQALYFQQIGFNIHDTMIYQKPGIRFPDSTRYHQGFEYMFVFSKGKSKSINLIKDRKNKTFDRFKTKETTRQLRKKDDILIKNTNVGFDDNVLKEFGVRYNIWEICVEHSTGRDITEFNWHPAVFPSILAHDHIISWSKEGDIVLDPFSGSGTTSIQAKITKRKYIGLEINKEYVEKSKKIIDGYAIAENKFLNKEGVLEEFITF